MILVGAIVLAGCRTTGLLFTKGSEFRILTPKSAATVTLPLEVSWSDTGAAAHGDRFAVFLDQGPISPGENLENLLPNTCKQNPLCKSASYLTSLNVYITSHHSLVLDGLPDGGVTGQTTGRETHSVTVVVINRAGTRVGEEFAAIDFVYDREGT